MPWGEIGYAYAKGIPVVGIRTDFRVCSDSGDVGVVNAMIQGSVVGIAGNMDEVVGMLEVMPSLLQTDKDGRAW